MEEGMSVKEYLNANGHGKTREDGVADLRWWRTYRYKLCVERIVEELKRFHGDCPVITPFSEGREIDLEAYAAEFVAEAFDGEFDRTGRALLTAGLEDAIWKSRWELQQAQKRKAGQL